jgi:hypothetical protein
MNLENDFIGCGSLLQQSGEPSQGGTIIIKRNRGLGVRKFESSLHPVSHGAIRLST